jgi:hypothetical protein
MRNTLAVAGATGLTLALVLGHYEVAVVIFCAYVLWTWVRPSLERRDRLRQVDPGWHRKVEYDHRGEQFHADDQD